MEFNVNVNVKLSLDSESLRLVGLLFKTAHLEEVAHWPAETPRPRTARKKKEPEAPAEESAPAPTGFDPKDPSPIQTVTEIAEEAAPAEEPSDLPFDNDANSEGEKPLPFVAIWTPEDARKARKVHMEYIENQIEDAAERDAAHKQMVKITKLYLQSAAYKHERNEKGDAITKEGLPVKKLDELDSDETLRFMYLCESMFYQPEEKKVYPFERLEDELSKCDDWEQVERDFVKTYNKK